jgi:hypothetical protein
MSAARLAKARYGHRSRFIHSCGFTHMSHMVQPGAPNESRFAYYLLMGMLGVSLLVILVFVVMMYLE